MNLHSIKPWVAFTVVALALASCRGTGYDQSAQYGELKSEDWPYNTPGSASTYTPSTGMFGAQVPNSSAPISTGQYQQSQWPYDTQRDRASDTQRRYDNQRDMYGADRAAGQMDQRRYSYNYPGMNVTSSEIREIQQALRDEGFDPGPVDGIFGSRTRRALMDFQQSEGLERTGWLNDSTVSALGVTVRNR